MCQRKRDAENSWLSITFDDADNNSQADRVGPEGKKLRSIQHQLKSRARAARKIRWIEANKRKQFQRAAANDRQLRQLVNSPRTYHAASRVCIVLRHLMTTGFTGKIARSGLTRCVQELMTMNSTFGENCH